MQKLLLIFINVIFGSLVLLSYYKGVNREPDLSLKLWGGVPKVLQPYIVASMFISALGYFFFTANFLLNINPEEAKFLGKFNYWSLCVVYLFILIPSALWIELSFSYMKSGDINTWYCVVAVLYCVGFFSVLLLLSILLVNPFGKYFHFRSKVLKY